MSDNVLQTLGRIVGSPRVLTALVGLGALVAVIGFSKWGMAPSYVPIVSGLPLNQVGQATQRLEEQNIRFQLESGGRVVAVEESRAAEARVLLAGEGLTGNSGDPGFELFDTPDWGMTDFTQKVMFRRALEGSLERTIGEMRGVNGAQVHLALRESSFLNNADRPSEASVVLQLGSGGVADEYVVEGIQSLVGSAVEDLDADNVMVLDDRGRLLSSPDDESGIGLSNRQLQVRRQVEGHLQSKAEVLVEQMVGMGNATVRVAADLNFDQIDRTVEAVDPDQQVLVSENRAEITPGSPEQGAASLTTATEFEGGRSVETLSRGGVRLERITVSVVVGNVRTEDANGTVAYEPRSAQELQRVEAVVRTAVGFDAARGDDISVVAADFAAPAIPMEPDSGMDVVAVASVFARPLIALVGVGVAFLLTMRILGSLRSMGPPPGGTRLAATGGALPGDPEGVDLGAPQAQPQIAPPQSFGPAVTDPAMTARVVRSWMNDGSAA